VGGGAVLLGIEIKESEAGHGKLGARVLNMEDGEKQRAEVNLELRNSGRRTGLFKDK
jgi:hypothetical protein